MMMKILPLATAMESRIHTTIIKDEIEGCLPGWVPLWMVEWTLDDGVYEGRLRGWHTG